MPFDFTFVGQRKPLDKIDIPRMAHRIDVSEDHFGAFFKVESNGRAFDDKGRPVMLFEPHVFWRCLPNDSLRQVAERKGLAYPKWRPGNYPKDSYPRLMEALQICQSAALKACSIGLSQVLVENHVEAGYSSPEAMWQAFMDDEEEHVEAMLRFILANGIADDLRAERWAVVARVYNGPGYAANGYDRKMAKAFAELKRQTNSDWRPDSPDPKQLTISDATTLKTVQRRLNELGYPEVGRADGGWGTKTRAAVLAFRADNDLPIIADVDQQLLGALMVAQPRAVSEERAGTTVSDLREAGSRKVAAADRTEAVGYATAAGGAVAAVTEASGALDSLQGVAGKVSTLVETLQAISPWALLALGAYVVYQQVIVKRSTVEDYRTGRYVGR